MNFIEKTAELPQNVREFLLSSDVRIEMEKACFFYGIEEERMGIVANPVGLIFVEDLQLETLPELLVKNLAIDNGFAYGLAFELNYRIFNRFPDYFKKAPMLLQKWQALSSAPLLTEDAAWKKVLEIEPWIIEGEKEKAFNQRNREEELRKYQAQLQQLTITNAVETYPELGEQLITSERIKLSMFPEPVRPSIKNWISDYTFTIGISNRDPIVRGKYLFKSENTQKLSFQDREKLALVLKSFEEKMPITINTKTKQVVFTAIEEKTETLPFDKQTINVNVNQGNNQMPLQKTSAPTFESNSDRLSAWRKNLPQKELLEKEPNILTPDNLRFSSPQTLSTEKPAPVTRAPMQNYSTPLPKQNNAYPTPRPMPRNVVNLKEN